MPKAQRVDDLNEGKEPILISPQGSVYIDNKLAAVDGSITRHGKTANGSSTVFVGGIPLNREDDKDTCGHKRKDGSSTVFVDGGNQGAMAPSIILSVDASPPP